MDNIENNTNDEKSHYIELLTSVYSYDLSDIKNYEIKELQKLVKKEEKKAILKNKNPNSFWILESLPAPKKWKTKTSSKAGWLIFTIFISVFVVFGIIMFVVAYNKTL